MHMKRSDFEIEVCANSVESCLAAQRGGADRVELCMGIPEGGTTPSYGEIKMAREVLTKTRLHVIIRNRGGDFLYTEQELQRMATHAKGMSTTFHRAFDRCRNPGKALEEIGALGFSRILTSGQQATAEKGIGLLRRLNTLSGGRVKIMAGCGVNEQNIACIYRETAVRAFHFSAREPFPSRMIHTNPSVYMGAKGADEDTVMLTTDRRVRNTVEALMEENG